MSRIFRRIRGPLLGLALFAAAFTILHREIASHPLAAIRAELATIPPLRVALALLATAGSYLALTVGDTLALRHLGRAMPYRRTATASFVSYGLAHSIGLAGIGGVSARIRLYGGWGLGAAEIARVFAFCQVTNWLGFVALAGSAIALRPPRTIDGPAALGLRALGLAMVAVALAYLALSWRGKRAVRMFGHDIVVPGPRTALAQFLASAADWGCAGTALWVLVGNAVPTNWPGFVATYLSAQVAGIASQVPGGLGVFEGSLLALLPDGTRTTAVLGGLVVFRIVYYLVPLALAAATLAVHEATRHRAALARWGRAASPWVAAVAPSAVSAIVFVAGAVLLISGATPAVPHRIATLAGRLPLGVLETSHVAASAAGASLLVLARGLQRRLDGAYHVATVVLSLGIVASLLKGLDWEEAAVLAFALAVLVAGRERFDRRASLLHEAFAPRWIVAAVAVFLGSVWVGLLAYRHVAYDSALWWRFAPASDAPRFLRASAAAAFVLIAFGVVRMLRPAVAAPAAPTAADLERAARVAATAPGTLAPLALLGDKSLLFSEDGDAFVMYGIEGRSWVALGDPVGPPRARRELAWAFRNEVDRHSGWTVFYQVPPASLPLYVDLGLQLAPLGEAARVPLASFGLDGHARKGLRHAVRKAEENGLTFEIVPAGGAASLLDDLRRISDRWLAAKNVREKRFSLGFFDAHYLARHPLAVVRHDRTIVAFANVLVAGDGDEVTIDLMRFDDDAPPGVMDYLLVQLMSWGRTAGHGWFDLGMAPLSGIEASPLSPAWNRLAAAIYRHGEHFYNFQGLRRFKEKFDPVWEPRYLAAPGGLAQGAVLLNVASLVAGGIAGIVRR